MMQQLVEINQYLNDFLPLTANQALHEDEILDIAEFTIPNTWQKTMVLQGIDLAVHTVNEFINFCKTLKFAEGFNPNEKPNKTQEMSSEADPSGISTGALMWPAKSSAQGKLKKCKHLLQAAPCHGP